MVREIGLGGRVVVSVDDDGEGEKIYLDGSGDSRSFSGSRELCGGKLCGGGEPQLGVGGMSSPISQVNVFTMRREMGRIVMGQQ